MKMDLELNQVLKDEIYNFFQLLTEQEVMREYEKKIVNFVMVKRSADIKPYLRQFMDDTNETIAFAAFCTLCEKLRRDMDHLEHKQVLDQYAERFSGHPFVRHVKLLYYVDHFDNERRDEIIDLARNNIKLMPNNGGVMHAFADIVAHAFEYNWIHNLNNPPEDSVLEEAILFVEMCISMDSGYAKFYCTKGRLLSFRGQYTQGLEMVQKAIDLEDSRKSDYPIRISNYFYYRQQIQAREQNTFIEKRINQYQQEKLDAMENVVSTSVEEIQGSMIKNIEFVGLFAGIISFTIGSISISSNLATISFAGAAGLIIVLMGALLCVFSGFGVILHGFQKDNWVRTVLVFLTGLFIVAVGLSLCFAIQGI